MMNANVKSVKLHVFCQLSLVAVTTVSLKYLSTNFYFNALKRDSHAYHTNSLILIQIVSVFLHLNLYNKN